MVIETSRDPIAFQAFELDGWDAVSSGYERHFGRLTAQTVPAILGAARVEKGTRLLDVCTGPGVLARAASARGAEVVGLDFSGNVIEVAKRNVPDVQFLQGDAQDLPFESGTFEAVVCGYGIIHVAQPQKALLEMHRVLRRGGRVAVSVWQAPTPTNGFAVPALSRFTAILPLKQPAWWRTTSSSALTARKWKMKIT